MNTFLINLENCPLIKNIYENNSENTPFVPGTGQLLTAEDGNVLTTEDGNELTTEG